MTSYDVKLSPDVGTAAILKFIMQEKRQNSLKKLKAIKDAKTIYPEVKMFHLHNVLSGSYKL